LELAGGLVVAALIAVNPFGDVVDEAGRILAGADAAEWTVLSLPALAEPNDPLGRMEGEALCPERFDESFFDSEAPTEPCPLHPETGLLAPGSRLPAGEPLPPVARSP
jgi:hypothetical protein